MYKHILVPLDGSPFAEQVLPHVEALAQQFGARVTVLRSAATGDDAAAMTAAQAATLAPAGTTIPVASEVDEGLTVTSYLRALVRRLGEQGIAAGYSEAEGSASEAIIEQARDLGADLIAMTTHGRSGLSRLYFGSVAEAVLRQAPCPILLVRMHDGVAPPRE
jgi:nucleotide-binding universal stress UspA family protein